MTFVHNKYIILMILIIMYTHYIVVTFAPSNIISIVGGVMTQSIVLIDRPALYT